MNKWLNERVKIHIHTFICRWKNMFIDLNNLIIQTITYSLFRKVKIQSQLAFDAWLPIKWVANFKQVTILINYVPCGCMHVCLISTFIPNERISVLPKKMQTEKIIKMIWPTFCRIFRYFAYFCLLFLVAPDWYLIRLIS